MKPSATLILLFWLTVLAVLLVWAVRGRAATSDYDVHQVPNVARPALDTPYTDSVFGSTVTRRTDPSMNPNSTGLRHEYSKFPPVSASNNMIAVQVIGGENRGAWQIRSLVDHRLIATLQTQSDPEISWSPVENNILLYRKGNQILRYHVDTGATDVLLTASAYTSISDNEEGRPSLDLHWWAGIGVKSDGTRDIIVVDLQSHTVVATLRSVTSSLDWVSISMSGQYVVAMYTDGKNTLVYDRQLVFQRQALADFTHADLALDADGQDIIVYIAVTGAQVTELGCPFAPNGSPLASVRLSDGRRKILLGDCYDANWNPVITGVFLPWGAGYHVSGILSRARPGWVLISTYADSNVPQMPFTREVFALKTDGSGAVERYAHHQSISQNEYFGEAHASSSWDGTLLFFASTWQQSGGHFDEYVIGTSVTPPIPPEPPDVDGGAPFTCRTKWLKRGDGTITGYKTRCVKQ